MSSTLTARRPVALLAAAALVLGGLSTLAPVASADPPPGQRLTAKPGQLKLRAPQDGQAAWTNPSDAKADRKVSYLIKLDAVATTRAFGTARAKGTVASAKRAATSQLTTVKAAQKSMIAALPTQTPVLYRTHSVLAGVAVTTEESNLERLKALPGVAAVYPIAPKSFSNAYAVPLQGAPAVWTGRGDLGQGTSIAVIDTGIDYTHANFGGPGTVAAFTAAQAGEASPADPSEYPTSKIIGGADLVGDSYNADPDDPAYQPDPHPDANPLDCNGHGSHVSGTATGLGVNADGTTYTGAYSTSTPFSDLRIGPGMAPAAKLYAYKVFGCEGSTDVTSAAIDAASDPNGDGDPSDHVDVINLSLGSSFGSPQDGDSVVANAATDLGITVVASAGNSGDVTDVHGSPGDAAKVLSVASTQDASNVVDGVSVKIGSGVATTYAASRSVAYDWTTDDDLIGTVKAAPAGTSTTGCAAYPAGTFTGRIAFVSWTDGAPECGSVARATNLAAAGAVGFLFGNSTETFSAGITGSATIPGVLVAKSGTDAIRTALAAGTTVTVNGTGVNSTTQLVPADNDKISSFSSRGIHAKANLKPDVAAVGQSVFSTAVGTGNEGASLDGTSMASPMVAGLAALVKSAHPNWSAAQVKADIMNTAGQDVYVNGSADTGSAKYAPVRVGAGRIKADAALENDVLAYNAEDAGTVSVGFGPVEVTGPMTLTKKVKVENTGLSTRTYAASYDAITSVPGVSYDVAPASVTLSPRSSTTVTVTFRVTDASQLTKTVDPTIGRTAPGSVFPRVTLAEASGRVLLTPSTGGLPTLRVPVYSAPRPASVMTQAGSLTLPKGASQSAPLALTGRDVDQGTGDAAVFSIAAGAELQATSGLAPKCSTSVTTTCYRLPEERSADLKHVGYTSDFPVQGSVATSQAYFAVTTQGAWSIPASKIEFDVFIDVDADNDPDLVLYNGRLGTADEFVSILIDLKTGQAVDAEPVNGAFGDLDTALYDSDSMLLPLYLQAMADYGIDAASPTIRYGVLSFTAYSNNPIDAVGINPATGELTNPLAANLFEPGVTVTDADGFGPLVFDEAGSSVTVTRNLASYRADKGLGLLMLHLHNKVGAKAQVVALKSAVTVGLTVSPTKIKRGQSVKATVKVTDPDGGTVSGTVKLVDQANRSVASGSLSGGSRTFTVTPTSVGSLTLKAVYAGDATHATATSTVRTVSVAKSASAVTVKLSPKTGNDTKTTSATIKVKAVLGVNPTGSVSVVRTTGSKAGTVAKGTLKNGSVVLKYKPKKGTFRYKVVYAGNGTYASGTSATVSYKAK